MDEAELQQWVEQYAVLKRKKAELETELAPLRDRILEYGEQRELDEWETGSYRVKLIRQNRRDYDDQKVYEAIPDLEVWRMLSRADSGKIASLLKLNVLSEEALQETYTTKQITLLHVDKQ